MDSPMVMVLLFVESLALVVLLVGRLAREATTMVEALGKLRDAWRRVFPPRER
ncbi:hypothetical protein ACFYWS_20410 [Streptomyces sp. NPDC002795]|uniref:hypothetical protein n=1 Tax=Streptomyces sp. NPDC002795 TaxID=3364665 RepID=UPI0036CB3814